MPSPPLSVSIAMPVRNACSTVEAAIRSILAQTYPDFEFLIIDDGSTDGTAEVVSGFRDPRIRLIRHQVSLGLAVRLNEAISMSGSPLFARMDADDVAYPMRLEAQVEFLERRPECDLVGCGVLFFDDAGRVTGRYPLRRTHGEICLDPWRGFFLPHPTWMGRRAWFARFGYLDSYRKTQDQDLLLRAFDSSCFACIDRTLLGYRRARRTLGKSLVGRAYFSRSIARESWRRRAWLAGCAGLAAQGAKSLADLLTMPFGVDEWLRGDAGESLSVAEREEWQTVWKACNVSVGK